MGRDRERLGCVLRRKLPCEFEYAELAGDPDVLLHVLDAHRSRAFGKVFQQFVGLCRYGEQVGSRRFPQQGGGPGVYPESSAAPNR